jgi:hypothetical protein
VVDDLYGAWASFWAIYGLTRRRTVDAVKTFEVLRKLRLSTILDVCERRNDALPKAITETFGVQVRTTTSEDINDAYKKADPGEAEKWAKAWIAGAKKVVEPKREEIVRSGLMYVAMRKLMSETKAQAIDIDCLRLFYGKKLPAYPCLGFFH